MSAAALSVKTLRGPSLRAAVFKRDGGVCALCGADTERARSAIEQLRDAAKGSIARVQAYREFCRALGAPKDGCWWHADHVVPVIEGGSTTLDNVRTLCAFGPTRGCHGSETRALRARMKRRPSRARADRRARRRAGQ